MRTHGWSGSAPASDDEAIARILDAASKAIDARGADFSIADVARTLGVTRQTVYRYFPSTDALLVAAAVHAATGFLDRLATHLQGITDPADAVAEAIATALEWLPKDKHLGLLIAPGRPNRPYRVGDVATSRSTSPTRWCADSTSTGPASGTPTMTSTSWPSTCCGSSSRSLSTPAARPDAARSSADYLRRWVGSRACHTTVSGSDFLGSNTNVEPPLNLTTETSRNSSAAVSVSIKRAIQSVSVPVTSTSRCGSTAATAACSGRFSEGPGQRNPGLVLMSR